MHQTERKWRTSGENYMGKNFNIMKSSAAYVVGINM